MSLSEAEQQRYGRHLSLQEIGAGGQHKLKAARVLIVGAGGLGSPAALYLAAAGIGTLGIADGDRVELSNLHRQVIFDTADIGAEKATAARSRLHALNPGIEINAHAVRLGTANVLETLTAYDLIVDGSDRLSTRYLLNDACVILARPLVSAAIHRFEGQAMTYVPNQGPCYRCLFPASSDDLVPNCAEAGVLGVLPGVLGTIQATEAIKLILGIGSSLVGRLLTYDALAMRFDEFAFKRRADCAVCGNAPTILAPRDDSEPDAQSPTPLRVLSPADLAALLRDPRSAGSDDSTPAAAGAATHAPAHDAINFAIVDVREPREFAVGHLPGSINLPLGQLQSRLDEIPRDSMPVFVCRSGARSLRACTVAARQGISPIAHLEGGLTAWARVIDRDLRVAV